ncbi:MAG: tRNA (adenosine(37)-N6)-dimethylallyltransferase MiaA [Bacteroidia bacterium]|nr:tRNA (adenosine(37)-N6)-dimethylallyltransferase MiaA [Bacteroidia bacterium]
MVNRTKLIVIVGPTAVGKTNVAIQLAQRFESEIISADSRQIYKELEIGTAKPTKEELGWVKHHFINIKSIDEDYDAGQFGRDALALINDLFKTHGHVILCGGSGLYVKSVTEGFDKMPVIAEGVREKIIEEYELNGLGWLQQQVEAADPEYFSLVDQKNPQRLMRALEINYSTGQPLNKLRSENKLRHAFEILKIGLELDREELYHRIDSRMDTMIEAGLFEEAKHFFSKRELNALQTVGYQEIFGYMDGLYNRDEAIRLLKRNSRRYAKRQMTWFKKDKDVMWYRPNEIDEMIKAIENT